jgi:hypothetical protein
MSHRFFNVTQISQISQIFLILRIIYFRGNGRLRPLSVKICEICVTLFICVRMCFHGLDYRGVFHGTSYIIHRPSSILFVAACQRALSIPVSVR